MMKAANFPAIYHNILKYEQNLSFTWPWVCHLFVRCGACWFAIAHHSVYSIIDRYLPYTSILFAALLHIVTFCAFFCAGFTLFYCVFIQCHLPAFSFYTSYPEEVYLNKWAKRQLNNKNNRQRRTKLFAGKIVLLALKSKDLAQKKIFGWLRHCRATQPLYVHWTQHRLWSRVNETTLSPQSTRMESHFCFHRSGLDSKQSFIDSSLKIGRHKTLQ